MFKKINKCYEALFGKDYTETPVCGPGPDQTEPIYYKVQQLANNNKDLTKIIKALLDHFNLESEEEWSRIISDYTVTIKRKSSK